MIASSLPLPPQSAYPLGPRPCPRSLRLARRTRCHVPGHPPPFRAGHWSELGLAGGSAVPVGGRAARDHPSSGHALDGLVDIIAQGKDELSQVTAAAPAQSDGGDSEPSSASGHVRYNRFEAQLRALQADPATFTADPEDAEDVVAWTKGFSLDERKTEIEAPVLRERNHGNLTRRPCFNLSHNQPMPRSSSPTPAAMLQLHRAGDACPSDLNVEMPAMCSTKCLSSDTGVLASAYVLGTVPTSSPCPAPRHATPPCLLGPSSPLCTMPPPRHHVPYPTCSLLTRVSRRSASAARRCRRSPVRQATMASCLAAATILQATWWPHLIRRGNGGAPPRWPVTVTQSARP